MSEEGVAKEVPLREVPSGVEIFKDKTSGDYYFQYPDTGETAWILDNDCSGIQKKLDACMSRNCAGNKGAPAKNANKGPQPTVSNANTDPRLATYKRKLQLGLPPRAILDIMKKENFDTYVSMVEKGVSQEDITKQIKKDGFDNEFIKTFFEINTKGVTEAPAIQKPAGPPAFLAGIGAVILKKSSGPSEKPPAAKNTEGKNKKAAAAANIAQEEIKKPKEPAGNRVNSRGLAEQAAIKKKEMDERRVAREKAEKAKQGTEHAQTNSNKNKEPPINTKPKAFEVNLAKSRKKRQEIEQQSNQEGLAKVAKEARFKIFLKSVEKGEVDIASLNPSEEDIFGPLPTGWVFFMYNDDVFYFNKETNKFAFERPIYSFDSNNEGKLPKPWILIKRGRDIYYLNPDEKNIKKKKTKKRPSYGFSKANNKGPLPAPWVLVDNGTDEYYFNEETDETSWDRPENTKRINVTRRKKK